MSRLRRIGLLLLIVGLAAVAVRLGFWQLDRLAVRRADNQATEAARALPPLDLGRDLPGERTIVGRAAVARGAFLGEGELRLRNRAHREAPGVHVVTPFRIAQTGAVVWVLRGFAHAADGVTPAAIPAPLAGEVTIRGVLAAFPVTGNRGRPAITAGDTTWQRLDSATIAARLPSGLPAFLYLAGDESGPGRLPAVPPPALDEGPHLSYAIQWFGIATAILAFGWLVVRKRAGRGPVPPAAAP